MLSSSTMKASAEYLDFLGLLDLRAAGIVLGVAVLLLDVGKLVPHQGPAAGLVAEQRADLPRARALVAELGLDHLNLEPRQAIQFQLEDGVGLLGVEREALDDLLRRVGLAVGLADDADDLVERVEDLLEALEQVDALLQLRQLVLQAAGHHFQAEVEEVPEHLLQVEALGTADLGILGRHEARQVDGEGVLQRGVLEQVRHHQVLVGAALQLQLDSHIVGGEIADVHEVRHLPAEDDVADLLDELRLVDAVGHAGDVEQLAAARDHAHLPGGADADRARAGAVDLLQLVGRVQDVAAGRKVRSLHPAAQLHRCQVRIVQQLHQRGADLVQVVRRDVGGHAHRDAGGAVDQQVRDARRQHHGLLPRAVVVRPEVDRLLLDLLQHFVGDPLQAALGVAHRRGGVAVERAEVAGAVHQRIAQRERLRHADQRLVDRRIAVRMEVAHHVADHLRALAVLGVGGQVLLPHRVEDAALHRLQAVTHIGQGAGGDHRQRVVQVPRLRRFVQRHRRAITGRGRSAAGRRRGRGRRLIGRLDGRVVVVEERGFFRTFCHFG